MSAFAQARASLVLSVLCGFLSCGPAGSGGNASTDAGPTTTGPGGSTGSTGGGSATGGNDGSTGGGATPIGSEDSSGGGVGSTGGGAATGGNSGSTGGGATTGGSSGSTGGGTATGGSSGSTGGNSGSTGGGTGTGSSSGSTGGGTATGGNSGSTGGGAATGGGGSTGSTGGGAATGGNSGSTGGGAATGGGGSTGSTGGGPATGGGTGTIAGFTPGPSGCQTESLANNVSVGGYVSDRYTWSDSNCLPRSAALVRNTSADPGGSNGGFLRELTFTINGATRTARGTGTNGWNGWGYVVNHYASSADNSRGKTGTYRTVLAGAHHAIHEFKVQMNPGGPVAATIHWFFATGRSEPVYAITYDVLAAANVVNADTRAPYGDLAFEGTPGPIGGIAWGDQYRFTTTGSGPVTTGSAWDYSTPNQVPFVRMWSSNVDAEMGAVQTETFAQHVGGGDYGFGAITSCQGKTSATRGSSCSPSGQTMPADWLWPFQLNQYELPSTANSHRLAWGSNYGAIGKTSVSAFGRSFSGYPQVKYGVFLVVGSRTRGDTMAKVTDVERLATATITGATWNPLYAVWDLPAVIGGTSMTIDPKGQTLTTPIVRLTNFTASQLTEVSLGGVPLQSGSGYFATLDAATHTLWITVNGTISSTQTLRVR